MGHKKHIMSNNVKEQKERKKPLVDVPKPKVPIPDKKSIKKVQTLITEKGDNK